jgi:hypothetical protein
VAEERSPVVKAKIRFVKFEKALAMQVLEMDERFRGVSGKSIDFKSRHMITISSCWAPQILIDRLFLRGKMRNNDLLIESVRFDDNDTRDKTLENYIAALKDWAENWEGFKETKPQETPAASGDDIVVEV